ncbi:hypothetical protein SO802_007900 [Lithocarpus litseifolius]|uniref:Uncharacterized protein n=1 Tax=Lithocarpus litseifolius TaxID=425828 RepID=A0AAW2DQB9_9ROSI
MQRRKTFGTEASLSRRMDEFHYCYKLSEIKQSTGFYQFSSRGPQFSLIKGFSSSDRAWKKDFFFIFGNWAGDPSDASNAPFPPFTSALGRLHPEAITRPLLDKFYLERIDRARAHPERSFHSLLTFRRFATMKENKGKNVASCAEEEEDVQVQDNPTPLAIQKFVVQSAAERGKAFQVSLTLVIFQDVEPENPTPPAAKTPYRVHPSVPAKRPPNLVLDEDYA